MIRTTERETPQGYRGMSRSTRLSVVAGVAVFLTLVSGVSFAAWTASSAKTVTATTGAVALSTATAGGAGTISALGPFTYTATNQTVTKPITVRNTGSVEASVTSITISRTGTLAGGLIAVKFWAGTSSACAATTPVVSSTLAGGTVSLSSLNMTLASTASATLCTSTTFTDSMSAQAGKTITATYAVNASAGTNWNTSDAAAIADRTFTQSIRALSAPSNMRCTTQPGWWGAWPEAVVSWSAPTAPAGTTLTYGVYFDNGTGPTLLRTISGTSTTISADDISSSGSITVIAIASNSTQSSPSTAVGLWYSNPWWGPGVSCAN